MDLVTDCTAHTAEVDTVAGVVIRLISLNTTVYQFILLSLNKISYTYTKLQD